jgi:hypothetical protein
MTRKQGTSEDLQHLHDWIRTITDHLKANAPEMASFFGGLEQSLTAAFRRGDARGLKMMVRDMQEWTRGMPPELVQQLDAQLRAKFGKGLREVSASEAKVIQKILKKGKIETEEEYRLLSSRVDEIHADPSKRNELEKINALLADHDNPARPR